MPAVNFLVSAGGEKYHLSLLLLKKTTTKAFSPFGTMFVTFGTVNIIFVSQWVNYSVSNI